MAKIGDAWITVVVHKDILLTERYYGGEKGFRTTYSFQISVNHVARVEVLEAHSNSRRLVTGVNVEQTQREGHLRVYVGLYWDAP